MITLRAKLELMKDYYTEIQSALLWHDSYMSWIRQRGPYNPESPYHCVYEHCTAMALERKEDRDQALKAARISKDKLDALK